MIRTILLLLLPILPHPSSSLPQSSLLSSGSWWRSPPPMTHSFYPPWHWCLWILLATTLSTWTFRHLCQLLLEWYGIWQAHRIRIYKYLYSTYRSSLFSHAGQQQTASSLFALWWLYVLRGSCQNCCDREMLQCHRHLQCGNGAMYTCHNTHTSMIASMNIRTDGWLNGWLNGWMNGWMDGWMHACMHFRTCACMYVWMHGFMYKMHLNVSVCMHVYIYMCPTHD